VDHGASVMKACAGEEVLIRAVHPGGRQRQHTFTTIGFGYDDLFPGFGFPNSALLGPGKVISASLTMRAKPGLYLWMDGTSTLREGGIWGLLSVETCN
jgi:manganese oxidase